LKVAAAAEGLQVAEVVGSAFGEGDDVASTDLLKLKQRRRLLARKC